MRRGLRGDHHWVYHLVNPPKDYLPNDELLETLDQFMDLFDNEGANFRKTFEENGGNFVSTITALAPINLLTAPIDFWEELHPGNPCESKHMAFLLFQNCESCL